MAAQAYSMDGAMAGWFFFIPASNFSGVLCTSSGFRKTSVEPHHSMIIRERLFFFLKLAMSRLSWRAMSYLVLPFFTFLPFSNFTYSWSNAAGIGLIFERNVFTRAR